MEIRAPSPAGTLECPGPSCGALRSGWQPLIRTERRGSPLTSMLSPRLPLSLLLPQQGLTRDWLWAPGAQLIICQLKVKAEADRAGDYSPPPWVGSRPHGPSRTVVPRLSLAFLQPERFSKAQGAPSVSVLRARPQQALHVVQNGCRFVLLLCWGILPTAEVGLSSWQRSVSACQQPGLGDSGGPRGGCRHLAALG